ncbi:MAG TPA: alpha/beta fold hydrolase [Thermoanaerobaculia bacterium]
MRRLFLILLALSLAGCASQPDDQPFTPVEPGGPRVYSADAASNPVGVIPAATLRDTQRNKDIELSIEYPTRGGPSPLIVWSHGFGGSSRGYVGLSSYWAANGYVVIKPTHADTGRPLTEAADLGASQTPADWRNRVADMRVILDSLDRLEQQYPELQGKIDRERIGVGGHSYGAQTAMLLAGARAGGEAFADPRIDAVIAMSPQGPTPALGLTTESWRDVRGPILYMTGSLDQGADESQGPEWRRQAFELSPAGDKWFVSIEGARHMSFSGRLADLTTEDLRTPPQPIPERDRTTGRTVQRDPRQRSTQPLFLRERGVFGMIRTTSLAFWDAYVRKETSGREYLDRLQGRTDVEAATK